MKIKRVQEEVYEKKIARHWLKLIQIRKQIKDGSSRILCRLETNWNSSHDLTYKQLFHLSAIFGWTTVKLGLSRISVCFQLQACHCRVIINLPPISMEILNCWLRHFVSHVKCKCSGESSEINFLMKCMQSWTHQFVVVVAGFGNNGQIVFFCWCRHADSSSCFSFFFSLSILHDTGNAVEVNERRVMMR